MCVHECLCEKGVVTFIIVLLFIVVVYCLPSVYTWFGVSWWCSRLASMAELNDSLSDRTLRRTVKEGRKKEVTKGEERKGEGRKEERRR